MKHENKIDYPGGFDKLAEDLGNLQYDTLAEFLTKLSNKLAKDSQADADRKRPQLAKQLSFASRYIGNAWKLCEPHMK
jgi:hypothetical protein